MYDTKLIKKAVDGNFIRDIDNSWRNCLAELKKKQFHLPFDGDIEYDFKILGDSGYTLVKGFGGTITIKKAVYRNRIYSMVKPIVIKKVSIYGYFKNGFVGFVMKPKIGFHFSGTIVVGYNYEQICTVGDGNDAERLSMAPENLEELKDKCKILAKRLECVNMDSLGGAVGVENSSEWISHNIGYLLEKKVLKLFFKEDSKKTKEEESPF